MEQQHTEFVGNDRFEIRRRLGAGTFGVVYEAYDQERSLLVALKNLRRISPQAIYNFKQEFRSLSDLAHPNIASLYELFVVEEQWFFTMELIEGVDFMAYVRQGSVPEFETIDSISSNSPTLAEGEFRTVTSPQLPPLSEQKLREAARQLAEGLYALHQAGKLHRDLKPSNVLCEVKTPETSRVVLLDFGLVMEQQEAAVTESRFVVGTAAFMSPEQAAGRPLTPASDWYSFGVMLFQALTGALPFTGDVRQVLVQKQEKSAPLLRQFADNLPQDLEILTMELLRREPASRPSGEEVLQRLGGKVTGRSRLLSSPFVGRERQLSLLQGCFEESAQTTIVAAVHGASGMGKSTLLKTFLREAAQSGALILQGKCYERESVPYKALDDLFDSLGRHLGKLKESELPAVIPPDIRALAKLFPGLERVKAIETAAPVFTAEDPKEQRRIAFSVLRQLLSNLAQKQPLILWVDDLQWGDLDSAALLEDLLRGQLPFLFVASYRSEEAQKSPFLQSLLSPKGYAVKEVAVQPLTLQEALDLTLQLLGDDDIVTKISPASIAKEAQGSPYLVDELVRFLREDASRIARYIKGESSLRVEEVLLARVDALPQDERRILDVLAVAGLPLTAKVLLSAAGLASTQRSLFTSLQAAKLVEVRGDDRVECFHDRLREALFGSLPPTKKKQLHEQIAQALLAEESYDPESLVFHLRESGAVNQAAEYAQKAAGEATRGLAFDRAASLYQQAIELGSFAPSERHALQKALGASLSNAGHSVRAAKVFAEAVKSAQTPEESVALQEKAAAELIRGGEIEEGFVILREILESLDLPMATSPTRALLRLVWSRVKIEVKGRKFTPRERDKVPAQLLRKIDICWSIAMGLGNIDTIHGADYQAKQMLFALEAGETYRVARALCAEAAFVAADGIKKRPVVEKTLEEAKALCDSLDDHYLRALFAMVSGERHFLFGEFHKASQLLQEAQELFRTHCIGVSWEIATCQFYQMYSLFYIGEITTLSRVQKKLSQEATERGDLYAATAMNSGHCAMGRLAEDRPAEAHKMVEAASKRWSPKGFHVQHFTELLMRVEADLYEGNGEGSYQRIVTAWPLIQKSLILQVQLIRVEATHLRARAILGVAQNRTDKKALLKEVEKMARSLVGEKVAWAEALAALLQAAVFAAREQKSAATEALERAAALCGQQHFTLYAAAAKYRQGQLLGGKAGEALQQEASQVFAEQLIVRPEAWISMLAPGFP